MHRHRRHRGKILFEVFCALGLAASFVVAEDQTGSPALLISASIVSLFAVYWAFGLFARDQLDEATAPAASVAAVQIAEVAPPLPEMVVAPEPSVLAEPALLEAEPAKRRPRKAKKAAAVAAPEIEQREPVAIAEPVYDGPPLEQLFDTQPFARQSRPAFGKKARGPRPVAVG